MLVALVSCKKEPNRLPPKTQEGRNTIGYRIQSSSYDDTLAGGTFGVRSDQFLWKIDSLFVSDDMRTGGYQGPKWRAHKTLEFLIDRDPSSSTVNLKDIRLWEGIEGDSSENLYLLDSTYFHFFEATRYDELKQILSAEFEFRFNQVSYDFEADTIRYVDSSNWIRIYDGRFDLQSD